MFNISIIAFKFFFCETKIKVISKTEKMCCSYAEDHNQIKSACIKYLYLPND